ncbi:MAG: hypothetical protein JNN25_09240 [Candidatus Kapabacteria bacterium]|nr:hypothetical protein [Candidatus Kapabacteria bacterium]
MKLYQRFQLYSITALFLAGCLATACTSEHSEEKPINNAAMSRTNPFTLPTDLATLKTDIRRVDLSKSGYEDAIVTVYPKDSMGASIGFEGLQIFEYDTTKKAFAPIYQEKFYYGKSLDVRDVDNDGTSEVCIKTDGGGNSAVASIGLTILKKQQGKYRRVVNFEAGNPEIITLASKASGKDTATMVTAVLMNDEYWPDYLPHTEAVTVVDSIVVLAQTSGEASRLRIQFFDDHLAKAQQRYGEAKSVLKANRSEQAIWSVYSEAIAVLRLMSKSSQNPGMAAFISTERMYWRAMLPKRLQQALDDVFSRREP